jgi:hypothetical protein
MSTTQTALIERINAEVQAEPDNRLLADVGELLIDGVSGSPAFANDFGIILNNATVKTGKGKNAKEQPSTQPLRDALKAHYDSLKSGAKNNVAGFTLDDVLAFLAEHFDHHFIAELSSKARPGAPANPAPAPQDSKRLEIDLDALLV